MLNTFDKMYDDVREVSKKIGHNDRGEILLHLAEEVGELIQACRKGTDEDIVEETGDVLYVLFDFIQQECILSDVVKARQEKDKKLLNEGRALDRIPFHVIINAGRQGLPGNKWVGAFYGRPTKPEVLERIELDANHKRSMANVEQVEEINQEFRRYTLLMQDNELPEEHVKCDYDSIPIGSITVGPI